VSVHVHARRTHGRALDGISTAELMLPFCRSDDFSQLCYGLLATSQWDAQPSSMELLHAAQVQPRPPMLPSRILMCSTCLCMPLTCFHALMQRGGKTNQMGHTLWISLMHHMQPELCGLAAVAEVVIYDICKTGLPVLELIR
jgi:hypothetical protein